MSSHIQGYVHVPHQSVYLWLYTIKSSGHTVTSPLSWLSVHCDTNWPKWWYWLKGSCLSMLLGEYCGSSSVLCCIVLAPCQASRLGYHNSSPYVEFYSVSYHRPWLYSRVEGLCHRLMVHSKGMYSEYWWTWDERELGSISLLANFYSISLPQEEDQALTLSPLLHHCPSLPQWSLHHSHFDGSL